MMKELKGTCSRRKMEIQKILKKELKAIARHRLLLAPPKGIGNQTGNSNESQKQEKKKSPSNRLELVYYDSKSLLPHHLPRLLRLEINRSDPNDHLLEAQRVAFHRD